MYYLVYVDHNSMAAHLTKSDCEVCLKCCITNAMDGTKDYICGTAVRKMGMLGVRSLKMKALTVKMETGTLIGKGRKNLTCFVYNMYKIKSKNFF